MFDGKIICDVTLFTQVQLKCPGTECEDRKLTGGGVYKRARRVIDMDKNYYLVTEQLDCHTCHKKYLGWGDVVMSQLDVGHRRQFPAILTRK